MKRLIFLLIFAFSPLTIQAETAEEKGTRIIKEAKIYNAGFVDFTADMVMILRNRSGEESSRQITIHTLEVNDDGDKSISLFHDPTDVKGTAMLTFSHGLKADDQWLFLPAVKRVKRINSKNKSGPFMGSEFAYEDLGSQETEKYTYKFIGQEKCAKWTCNIIERRPVYSYSGYARQLIWLDTEKFRASKVEYYDRKNKLLKTLVSSDFREYLKHYWKPQNMEMKNHQAGKSTTLSWSNYQFKTGLQEKDFNKNKLKSLR